MCEYTRKNKSYVQDAYASYSIESRVKVIPRYVELPCERILLDPPPRIRLEKENFTANFSIEIENLQLRDLFQIKFLSYPLEKKKKNQISIIKKREKENSNSTMKNFHKISMLRPRR